MAACLPEQFIRIERLPPAVADDGIACVVVQGVAQGGLQGRLVQPCGRQHAAYAVDVERLPGVRRTGKGEQVRGQVQPELDHGDGLDRLVARARQHGRDDLAHRPVDRPVGREGNDRAVVVALDEPGADDLSDDGQPRRHGRHGAQATDRQSERMRG